MQARGHQEVARTLGRARGQDRRLELDEALRLHAPADARDHPRAQQDVALHRLAPQIEEAEAQPGVLGIVALGIDLERQLIGGRLDDERIGDDLDLAGRQRRIDRVGAARDHAAGHGQHALETHRLGGREEGMLGLKDDLGDAVVIAQVDEQQLAVVALAVHPAGQAHGQADLSRAQLAAVVGAIGMHAGPRGQGSRRCRSIACRGVKVIEAEALSSRQGCRRCRQRPPRRSVASARMIGAVLKAEGSGPRHLASTAAASASSPQRHAWPASGRPWVAQILPDSHRFQSWRQILYCW